ncbi:PAS domain S-box-containing protein, partial [Nitrosomonas aestuarii]
MEILPGTYDYNQVVISVLVAILASYVTFDLIGIAWNEKKRKNHQKWLVVSASVLGVGIWTMHFIGMFSYRLPIPIHYELIQTVISLFMAIIGNYFGFLIINKHHDIFHQGLASSLMGAGIVGMHYTGIKAMHIQADMHFNFTLMLLSIFIAVSVSWVALRLFIDLHSGKIVVSLQKKLMIACVMGVAISGMHYTSMTATHFTSSDHTFSQMNGVMIGGDSIFAAIVFSSVLLILTGIFLAKIKIGLTEQFAKELGLMRINERQLRLMIENSPDAFFVHDSQGKILDINKAACNFLGYTH